MLINSGGYPTHLCDLCQTGMVIKSRFYELTITEYETISLDMVGGTPLITSSNVCSFNGVPKTIQLCSDCYNLGKEVIEEILL